MRGLDLIGLRHGTDKSSEYHDYLQHYEREIAALPVFHEGGHLLELGWLDGASIATWREWLPRRWRVTGVDIDPKDALPGTAFYRGDQADPGVMARITADHGAPTVVVDDASHECGRTIDSFHVLWGLLAPGGLYFVEDLTTSYLLAWGGDPDPDARGARTSMQFLRRLADSVHHGHMGTEISGFPDVAQVSFWPGLAMVRKDGA